VFDDIWRLLLPFTMARSQEKSWKGKNNNKLSNILQSTTTTTNVRIVPIFLY